MQKAFNSNTFQNEVMQTIENYQDFYDFLESASADRTRHEASVPPSEAVEKAEELLERNDIRHYICPALQSISKDAYDIGKVLAAVLIPLALSNTISIPLDPVVFGLMAIMISKMGIASLCADFPKEKNIKD